MHIKLFFFYQLKSRFVDENECLEKNLATEQGFGFFSLRKTHHLSDMAGKHFESHSVWIFMVKIEINGPWQGSILHSWSVNGSKRKPESDWWGILFPLWSLYLKELNMSLKPKEMQKKYQFCYFGGMFLWQWL